MLKFFFDNKIITLSLFLFVLCFGILTSPFNWNIGGISSMPMNVDAIPDIGDNQQIIFTKWEGASPQDVDDQITYPLTSQLLGIAGVKTIRSSSMFGFSVIYIIFEDDVDFYWSRTRILEKINSLPENTLPRGITPNLGPDATGLGQIFWYTLDAEDEHGNPITSWDLQDLRTIQDYYVKFALSSIKGVSEVSSIGGYVKEYQIDINPSAIKAHKVSLNQIIDAVKNTNKDVGAKTIEVNRVEYFVRGLGYIKTIEDIEKTVIKVNDNIPIRIKDIAKVSIGPANRRGVLDKMGEEAVGGVVVARYGSNPMEVINRIKAKISQIEQGIPTKKLADGRVAKVKIKSFYDRSKIITETLSTLESALSLEILITIIVVIVMLVNLRISILISFFLPIPILFTFILMKISSVDANIMALSGIAIAIGTIVDVSIILSENVVKYITKKRKEGIALTPIVMRDSILGASKEVVSPIITAISTTIISFIPVFFLQAAEGKLFKPLAITKTYVLISSLLLTLVFLPTFIRWFLVIGSKSNKKSIYKKILLIFYYACGLAGFVMLFSSFKFFSIILIGYAVINIMKVKKQISDKIYRFIIVGLILSLVLNILTKSWMPLGFDRSFTINYLFLILFIGSILSFFIFIMRNYSKILSWALQNKKTFLAIPIFIFLFGFTSWLGFSKVFYFASMPMKKIGIDIEKTLFWKKMSDMFPGISKEFMPSLNEGSFLYMPTSMQHSGMEENINVLKFLDKAAASIPEVEMVVGKLGRAESALDPAPISMFENIINYKSEYITDDNGNKIKFANDNGLFIRKNNLPPVKSGMEINKEDLIRDDDGSFYRQWRDHIKNSDDIWKEIVKVSKFPGVTSAPKLQPIETRLVMLQTGMRSNIGIKIKGPELNVIEEFGIELEKVLKEVPAIEQSSVFADRIVGKPYIHLNINRDAIALYGLKISEVQKYIETVIGGMSLDFVIKGRERYPIRMRYPRELRDNIESLKDVLIPVKKGFEIPLSQVVDIQYFQGPQSIKSEDSFLVSYVLFESANNYSEIASAEQAKKEINDRVKEGKLNIPDGVMWEVVGNYENQIRSERTLSVIIPIVFFVIIIILYLQFKSLNVVMIIFSAIMVAFSGAFSMIWLYGQPWFMDLTLFGINTRDLFNIDSINISVAVWIGFIALFGIVTDDGVVMSSYLNDMFNKNKPKSIDAVRKCVIKAGCKRIRPCLMTTATTILALIPIITSNGRGADVMIPMAIPSIGGMAISIITLFITPVMYSLVKEKKIK